MSDKFNCTATCEGCGLIVYWVVGLPESARADIDDLVEWFRANTHVEHRRKHPGCAKARLRKVWSRQEGGVSVQP